MLAPQHLHVFLASPSDVADERALARRLLKDVLPYDPFLRGRMTFDVVSWDDPAARTPMPARLTPQEAVIRFETKPSDCDVVVVILWSRLGTHLDLIKFQKPNGDPYLSGTEWEYEDACKGKPEIFIYRRTEVPKVDLNDPAYEEKRRQYQLVGQFCERISQNPDGSFRGNVTDYDTPTAFEERLTSDLKRLLRDHLDERGTGSAVGEAPVWTGSPYPGLRPFTTEEAVIFFGRGREVDALIARLRDPAHRFLAVVGASGTGKSSLVRAGLIPRLKNGALEGSQDWRVVTCTPGATGDNPFLALAVGLVGMLSVHAQKPPIEIATTLSKSPQHISEYAALPATGAVVLFVDQLEELFTHAAAPYREPFGALLAHAAAHPQVRVVATLRADFLPQGAALPDFASLVQEGTFVLAPPGPGALADMIRKPAERAGLELQDGLADEILEDAGTAPGALALMAFALFELYQAQGPDGHLTHVAYERLGRVQGAIAKQAEDTFTRLDPVAQATLYSVFGQLVEVDERGVVARQHASRDRLVGTEATKILVDALTNARLLVASSGLDEEPVVDVAHEALLTNWPRLAAWIDATREDLRLLQQVRLAAAEWDRHGRMEEFLWPSKRLLPVHAMLGRLKPDLNEAERAFVRTGMGYLETDRLLDEIHDPATSHERRAAIGDRLAVLGDTRAGTGLDNNGLPAFEWCDVPGEEVALEEDGGVFNVKPFLIAKYPVTWLQYRAFLEAPDGYRDQRWWDGLASRNEQPGEPSRALDNHPAEHVSWYDAVAFCRWLSAHCRYEVRLPMEWEWQQAAMAGDTANVYPWGSHWDWSCANTDESELRRTTAVGMYPRGASPGGIVDLSGNVWEWCANGYQRAGYPEGYRVVRGGSWRYNHALARTAARYQALPFARHPDLGLRVVRPSPLTAES